MRQSQRYNRSKSLTQAAEYAKSLQLESVTIALFVPTQDDTILEQLSVIKTFDGVTVSVTAIGWE